MKEEGRDQEFFNSLRVPSISIETIINLSSNRIKEMRSQNTHLKSTVTDLRSTVSELRQSHGRATRAAMNHRRQSINLKLSYGCRRS